MSRLSDLRAALDELDSAKSERELPLPVDEVTFMRRQARVISASKRLWDTVDTDTIRTLLDVAEAAERRRIEEEREYSMTEPLPSPEWDAAEAALEAALDVLVKEENDEQT